MTLCPENHPWRSDYSAYKKLVIEGYEEAIKDIEKIKILQAKWPDADITKSLWANVIMFWGTADGWANKKAKLTKKRINMAKTLIDSVEFGRHLVPKSPFAPRTEEIKRDAKPVITEAEERRNYKISSMVVSIVAAITRLSDVQLREKKSHEFNDRLQVAISQGTTEGFVENYYENLSSEHPEVFIVKKEDQAEPVHISTAMDDAEFLRIKQEQLQKINKRIGV